MKVLSMVLGALGFATCAAQVYLSSSLVYDRQYPDNHELDVRDTRSSKYDYDSRASTHSERELLDALALRYLGALSSYASPTHRRAIYDQNGGFPSLRDSDDGAYESRALEPRANSDSDPWNIDVRVGYTTKLGLRGKPGVGYYNRKVASDVIVKDFKNKLQDKGYGPSEARLYNNRLGNHHVLKDEASLGFYAEKGDTLELFLSL